MSTKSSRPRAHIAVISDKQVQGDELIAVLGEIGQVRIWPPSINPKQVAKGALCVIVDARSLDPDEAVGLIQNFAEHSSLPLICVIDRAAGTASIKAALTRIRALGAATIARPFKAADIVEIIRTSDGLAFERDAIERGGAVGAGVAAAHSALSSILEVSRTGRSFTFDEIKVKDTLIVEALNAAGIKAWLEAVKKHHSATYRHSLLVTGFAVAFAQALRIGFEDQRRIARAGLLHDVGKAFIPVSILEKPGVLMDEEMAEVKKHPALGHDHLVKQGGFPDEILDCVLHHHEYLDGSGYPDGLKGEEIVDLVRIITISDIFSALSEQRPYKPPLPSERALGIMEQMHGKLDRDLLNAFRPVAWDAAKP